MIWGRGSERGFAIVAAVAALAVFAAVAYAILASVRGSGAELRDEFAQAQLEAAAEAGLSMAIEGLAADDPARRWPLDGRAETRAFNGDKLTIVVEDELGKVPLSDLTADQTRRLFEGAGARGDQLDRLANAYQDLFEADADPKRHAEQMAEYQARGLLPQNGGPATVDDLAEMNGMDAATFARVRRVLTTHFGASAPFSARTASPLAIAVMSDEGENGVDALERSQETSGERTALEISDTKTMAGHAVTVVVDAVDHEGDRFERRTVVEFTGKTTPAFYIRQVE